MPDYHYHKQQLKKETIMSNKSQKDMILIHLQMHKTITTWEAIDKFHATRLSAIIFNLKEEGYNIANIGSKEYAIYEIQKASEYAKETEGS